MRSFFYEDVDQYYKFNHVSQYQFNIMEFDITNKIKMLDNYHIITILIYLRFSEEDLGYLL